MPDHALVLAPRLFDILAKNVGEIGAETLATRVEGTKRPKFAITPSHALLPDGRRLRPPPLRSASLKLLDDNLGHDSSIPRQYANSLSESPQTFDMRANFPDDLKL